PGGGVLRQHQAPVPCTDPADADVAGPLGAAGIRHQPADEGCQEGLGQGDQRMRYFVTGGAGFIGSNLVDRLLADGHAVTVYDNLGTGQREFLEVARRYAAFRLVEADLLDTKALAAAMAGHNFVFHFAANADVRFGTEHPRKDLEQNTIATFHVLETMRASGIRRIAFSSTGSIYGEPTVFATPENGPFPTQAS